MRRTEPLDPRKIEIVDDAMIPVLRAKTGAERLAIAYGLYSYARESLLNYLRKGHPEWSETQVIAETAKRLSHGTI